MAADSNARKITILLDERHIDELGGWLTIINGEVLKIEKPRRKTSSTPERSAVQASEVAEDTPRESHDLQREVVSSESGPLVEENPHLQDEAFCVYCRNAPCILAGENLPARLRASGQPRLTNHTKRKGDYRAFYTLLKKKCLWRDPVYLERKQALGCYIEDVREVMPICVVEDVRKRWPNPDGVPYCGHRRS